MPWEDGGEYRALVDALAKEHAPRGPTEEHLVEELAGVHWRKRRLRMAEASAFRQGLEGTLKPYGDTVKAALVHLDDPQEFENVVEAIRETEDESVKEQADLREDGAMTGCAIDLLGTKRNDAYEAALAALREDTREWWADVLARDPNELEEDEAPATADADGLRRFFEAEVLP